MLPEGCKGGSGGDEEVGLESLLVDGFGPSFGGSVKSERVGSGEEKGWV